MERQQWLENVIYGTPFNQSEQGNLFRGIEHQSLELYKTLKYIYSDDPEDQESIELAFNHFLRRTLRWIILDGEPTQSDSIIIQDIIDEYNTTSKD